MINLQYPKEDIIMAESHFKWLEGNFLSWLQKSEETLRACIKDAKLIRANVEQAMEGIERMLDELEHEDNQQAERELQELYDRGRRVRRRTECTGGVLEELLVVKKLLS